MSAWGVGIKQSDEFMEVYDKFDELYRDGVFPVDVARLILDEYLAGFDEKI